MSRGDLPLHPRGQGAAAQLSLGNARRSANVGLLHRRQESPAKTRYRTEPVQVAKAGERSVLPGQALRIRADGRLQQVMPAAPPGAGARSRPTERDIALLRCCTRPVNCGLRISDLLFDLGGAKGIRTPDLLHAISRQHVHRRPSMQVTVPGRAHESSGIWAGCGTFLLYRAEPAPLLTPADTRPVESLRIYRAGYQEPRTPSASQGQQVQL